MSNVVHCWESEREWIEETYGGRTCMLPEGHDGPHEWTPDDEIVLCFKDPPETAERKE